MASLSTERVGGLAVFLTMLLYMGTGGGGSGLNGAGTLHLGSPNGKPLPGDVLVTGGAGFIGSHATMRLMDDGYAVTIIDNFSRGNAGAVDVLRKMAPKNKLRVVNGDLGIRADVQNAFTQYPVDAVIHFAGLKAVGESVAQPMKYYSNNIVGTVVLVEVMEKHGYVPSPGTILSSVTGWLQCLIFWPRRFPSDCPRGCPLTRVLHPSRQFE